MRRTMSELVRSLSMPELNAYVVLINCCIRSCNGTDLNALTHYPKPDIYINDLIEHGYSKPEAHYMIKILCDKKLIAVDSCKGGQLPLFKMWLTDQWKNLRDVWPRVSNWTDKIRRPEYQLDFDW